MNDSIGLITLNARFIHSSLSLRYLRNAARDAGYKNVWIREYVIDQPIWKIGADILGRNPAVLGISVYIWKRNQSFELIERLKKQAPGLSIAVGGPEVSFDVPNSWDFVIIAGEGEKKWVEFLGYRQRNETPPEEVLACWKTFGEDLPGLVPPYIDDDIEELQNRIVYIETSRGCPYLCSFCLSALDKSVRYFDDGVIRHQIQKLVSGGIKKIKFVDRTFNLKPGRMKALLHELSRLKGVAFHFEVVGDILTPDLLNFLDSVPEGMFQFEIGIQTTNEEPQRLIQRKQDNRKLFHSIQRLLEKNLIHIHCDLIFGLPGETLEQSLRSFAEVCRMNPHELQIGFLKFLPGAPIKNLIEKFDYQYQSHPPYEILSSKNLSPEQLNYLKKFSEVFDLFYNSKKFRFTLSRLLEEQDPVDVFDRLLNYMEKNGGFGKSLNLEDRYRTLSDAFGLERNSEHKDLLKLDYLYAQRVYRIPPFMKNGSAASIKPKTWSGDKKTPVIPFNHEIKILGSRVHLSPSDQPLYYAVVHPENSEGYLHLPKVERVNP